MAMKLVIPKVIKNGVRKIKAVIVGRINTVSYTNMFKSLKVYDTLFLHTYFKIIYETPPSPPTSPESYSLRQTDLITIPEPVDFQLMDFPLACHCRFNVSTPATEFPKAITTFSVEISTRLPLHAVS